MIKHAIQLDMKQKGYTPSLFTAVVNDDKTRTLEIDLDYKIPLNSKIFITFKKPYGNYNHVEVEKSEPLLVELTSDILNQQGEYLAELKIITEDSQITSSMFKFTVRNELKQGLEDKEVSEIEQLYKDTIKLENRLSELLEGAEGLEPLTKEIKDVKRSSVFSIRRIENIE